FDFFDHFDHAPQAQVAGHLVELGADVVFGAVAGAGGALDPVPPRLDDDALVDQLLSRDGVGDGEQLGLVGGGCCGGCRSHDVQPSVLIRSAPSVLRGAVAAMSLSVKSSLAEAMELNGTWRMPLVVETRIVSPEMPSMIPDTCLAPSLGGMGRAWG